MPLQESGQRLFDGVGLVEVGGYVEHQRGRRREVVQREQFVPGIAFGEIERFDDIEQVWLDLAKLDRLAPQAPAQQRPALPQTLVGLVDRQRVVGCRALQEIVPLLAVDEQQASDVVGDSLVVKHGCVFGNCLGCRNSTSAGQNVCGSFSLGRKKRNLLFVDFDADLIMQRHSFQFVKCVVERLCRFFKRR